MSRINRGGEILSSLKGIFIRLLFAVGTGLAVGTVCSGFYYGFQWVTDTRSARPFLLFLLPIGGIVTVFVYRSVGLKEDKGTDQTLFAARENGEIPLTQGIAVFLSTLITHLLGGSAGREGAVLQIGGSVSSALGHLCRIRREEKGIAAMCGMSAGFASLFGAPLAGCLFTLEVVQVGVFPYPAFVPCLISAQVAVLTAKAWHVPASSYTLVSLPEFAPSALLRCCLFGILTALAAVLFCKTMRETAKFCKRKLPSPFLRIFIGGVFLIVCTYALWIYAPGTYDYNGAGGDIILSAVGGSCRPEAFLLKLLFTAVTLGVGFKGGEIVPVLFCGSTFGCAVGPLLGLNPSFAAGLGMVSLFCGVTNCPVASIALAVELFGNSSGFFSAGSLTLFAASVGFSFLFSGNSSLYSEQKFLFSEKSNPARRVDPPE